MALHEGDVHGSKEGFGLLHYFLGVWRCNGFNVLVSNLGNVMCLIQNKVRYALRLGCSRRDGDRWLWSDRDGCAQDPDRLRLAISIQSCDVCRIKQDATCLMGVPSTSPSSSNARMDGYAGSTFAMHALGVDGGWVVHCRIPSRLM